MVKKYNPDTIYDPVGPYVNVAEIQADDRLLVTAGIVGITREGELIVEPAAQIEQAWKNVLAVLEGAGMTKEDLVRLTTYVTSADYIDTNRVTRERVLGGPMGCTAIGIIAGLFDPKLVIEIDVMAAKP